MNHCLLRAVETPLGVVTLCASEQELCALYLPDTPLPEVTCGTSALLERAAKQLEEYFLGQRRRFSLPLHQPEPGFRGAVQRALEEIPYGEHFTYGQLARAAGRPRAHRAAGTACGLNPLPIFRPCHRVIRADGTLGNYRGGTPAKAWLLNLEGTFPDPSESKNT